MSDDHRSPLPLQDLLRPTVDTAPSRPAIHGSTVWTYGQLEERASQLARRWLTAGLEPGDRVALLLPNLPETLLVYLACFKSGLVAVPLDYNYRPPQLNYALRHSGSRLLVAHADRLDEVAECEAARQLQLAAVAGDGSRHGATQLDEGPTVGHDLSTLDLRGDDVAIIFYTSGTTGRPKGVTLTRAAITAGSSQFLARVTLGPTDVALVVSPLMRSLALRDQSLPTLSAGGSVALVERYTPETYLAALRRPPAKTFLAIIPASLHAVLSVPGVCREDFAGLRLCISGGDRVPIELQRTFHALTGVEITEQCGMSETGVYAQAPPFGRKKPGSIGLPMYGVQLCLFDDHGRDVPAGQLGEIVVRSPLMMDGYWNDTAQTRKALRDGWCHTGDLGRFDEDGYLWFLGRKKDIIKHDAWIISPAEVEEALLAHPSVAEACVVGVTDAVHGQNVHGFVLLRSGATPATEEELRNFAGARLSRQMVPERVHVVAELPRTGAGKIDRNRLQWQAEAGMGAI